MVVFLSHGGTPLVIIHFERWDFPVHKNHPFKGTPLHGNPPYVHWQEVANSGHEHLVLSATRMGGDGISFSWESSRSTDSVPCEDTQCFESCILSMDQRTGRFIVAIRLLTTNCI